MAKVRNQDLFMQWFPVGVTLNGSDTTSLASSEMTTGLSIRGTYAWLVHRVEMEYSSLHDATADCSTRLALSTERDRTTMPTVDDKGVIVRQSVTFHLTTSGACYLQQPLVWPSLPPTIIASPFLTFYAVISPDIVACRGDTIYGRVGFTTVPLDDQKMYLEIAETFETL
jgi:hypothetical protein